MIPAEKSTFHESRVDREFHEPGSDPRPRVTVVFTTVEATLAALRAAGRLAEGLHVRIALLAVQVVPYRLALGLPAVPGDFLERQLLALAANASTGADEIKIDIFLCRDRMLCLARVLPPRSVVVIGGRRWWWSWELRLRRWLSRLGHQVLFVDASRRARGLSAKVNELA